jgi:4-hydroxy-3-polyprenylbenzoate decarboxylase
MRQFLRQIEQAGQLTRVAVKVDPCLELATIVDQVCKRRGGGPALLFERVEGTQLAVAANLFGAEDRVSLALGGERLDRLVARFAADLRDCATCEPRQALARLTSMPSALSTLASQPEWQRDGRRVDSLMSLPMLTAWPGDGGAYLTLAQIYTRHPEGGPLNCGMYRVQIHDGTTATIRCRQGSGADLHLQAWWERGLAMPVAIALGGPPMLTWAAGIPLPEGVDEISFCGYLSGRPLCMAGCDGSDLQVPASAEIVIEGTIAPGAVRPEGPFGNHTGGYDAVAAAPEVKVQSVGLRRNAICPWTLVGPPPMENIQLARVTAGLFLPVVQMVVPSVRALYLPAEGIYHRAALITVDRSEDRSFAELARQLWGTLLLNGARLLVVGVDDHDPADPKAVFWRLLNRVDWARDLLVVDGKLAIDARRLPVGGPVCADPAILARVMARWDDYRIDNARQ